MDLAQGSTARGAALSLLLLLWFPLAAAAAVPSAAAPGEGWLRSFREEMERIPGRSGIYVLEKGEESLLARAWLADHATASIDVQYFIWSTDNIGILAAEALLRAAERGVQVRVLVDDLLLDADEGTLVALAAHPNIEIRIYNPVHKVGVPKARRIFTLLTDFRAANQRMHDKTFIVDRLFAITGGRNMADEYFDYNRDYNFRDRDILLLGPVAQEMTGSFEDFWNSPLARPVETLLKFRRLKEAEIGHIYEELFLYARDPGNFAPEVREVLSALPEKFPQLLAAMVWEEVNFLHDRPGKNEGRDGLGGGGETTASLVAAVRGARERIVIQSPYLVLTDEAMALFRELVRKGVEIRISTNSLGSTDNLMAFSGYRKQRKELIEAGVQVFEFQPHPEIQRQLVDRYPALAANDPVFAIHAKTLVVDGRTVFIGTFNLDPRSANLNTEVGVLFTHPELAARVEEAILRDMGLGNSCEAGRGLACDQASWSKRLRLRFWEIFPLDPLL